VREEDQAALLPELLATGMSRERYDDERGTGCHRPDGRRYAIHFWLMSAAAVPAFHLLPLVGQPSVNALPRPTRRLFAFAWAACCPRRRPVGPPPALAAFAAVTPVIHY